MKVSHYILALVVAAGLSGCASNGGLNNQTVNAIIQIAAIEAAAHVKPEKKVEIAAVLKTVSKQVRVVAESGVVNGKNISDAVNSAKTAAISPEVKRYVTELALVIDLQYKGITVDKVRALDLADRLDSVVASLQ